MTVVFSLLQMIAEQKSNTENEVMLDGQYCQQYCTGLKGTVSNLITVPPNIMYCKTSPSSGAEMIKTLSLLCTGQVTPCLIPR